MSELPEAAYDLDMADADASTWNRCATGLLDEPTDVDVTAADVLVITAAESVVRGELLRWLGLDP